MGTTISLPQSAQVAHGNYRSAKSTFVELLVRGELLEQLTPPALPTRERHFAPASEVPTLALRDLPEGPHGEAVEYRAVKACLTLAERRERTRHLIHHFLPRDIPDRTEVIQEILGNYERRWCGSKEEPDPRIKQFLLDAAKPKGKVNIFVRWLSMNEFESIGAHFVGQSKENPTRGWAYSAFDSLPLDRSLDLCVDCNLNVYPHGNISNINSAFGCSIHFAHDEWGQFLDLIGGKQDFPAIALLLRGDNQIFPATSVVALSAELDRAREVLTRTTLPRIALFNRAGEQIGAFGGWTEERIGSSYAYTLGVDFASHAIAVGVGDQSFSFLNRGPRFVQDGARQEVTRSAPPLLFTEVYRNAQNNYGRTHGNALVELPPRPHRGQL